MPSGKQSKRKRRVVQAPPPPTRARRHASPRVLMAAAAVVLLVVVGIVLAVVVTSGSGSSSASGARLAFMQLLYDNQGVENTGWLNDNIVDSAAVSIPGLDVSRFLAQVKSSAVADQVTKVNDQATADALTHTLTILVGKTGTQPRNVAVGTPSDPSAVAAAVDAALR